MRKGLSGAHRKGPVPRACGPGSIPGTLYPAQKKDTHTGVAQADFIGARVARSARVQHQQLVHVRIQPVAALKGGQQPRALPERRVVRQRQASPRLRGGGFSAGPARTAEAAGRRRDAVTTRPGRPLSPPRPSVCAGFCYSPPHLALGQSPQSKVIWHPAHPSLPRHPPRAPFKRRSRKDPIWVFLSLSLDAFLGILFLQNPYPLWSLTGLPLSRSLSPFQSLCCPFSLGLLHIPENSGGGQGDS